MKAITLGAIVASTVLCLKAPEAKAELLPFYETCPACGHSDFSEFWTSGGQKIGWNGGSGSAWSFSHNPLENGNGVEMKIVGPLSGNSYGAEAWVKTVRDFNDGNDWLINFSWNADRRDTYHNRLQLQITDGYTDPAQGIYWECRNIPGTVNLLTEADLRGPGNSEFDLYLHENLGIWAETRQNYSLEISPNGRARLFDETTSPGRLLTEKTLDKSYPWYFRVMAKDATSSGLPAGDYSINVNDVSASQVPEPSSAMLLLSAGALGAGYLAFRKK